MPKTKKKKKSTKKMNTKMKSHTKGNVAKILAAVGAVGAGAFLFTKRDKVKQVVKKWISKVKKAA